MPEPNPELIQTIKQRLEKIRANIAVAAQKCNRSASEVLLLAVSKRTIELVNGTG